MQYAAHLPNVRNLLVPVLALTIGAAGATATYAILDDTDVTQEPTRVIVTETNPPSDGVAAKDEARTAATVSGGLATETNPPSDGVAAKDEARTATAVSGGSEASGQGAAGSTSAHRGGGPPAEPSTPSETAQEALRTDPHGYKQYLPRAIPQP
ncbi:MAG TPA: hypothetical protein VHJ37_10090 [Thermoleophilaceae bacterium]|jgi:hypothetical protein|nr:hypothetical protein [Thermoleophilaceae bacterium]